jgi:hypothetical protein
MNAGALIALVVVGLCILGVIAEQLFERLQRSANEAGGSPLVETEPLVESEPLAKSETPFRRFPKAEEAEEGHHLTKPGKVDRP